MKKSRSVQMIQRDPLIAVVMIASRSAMKIVASDFRNTKRTGKSYKFLATYDFGFVICNACWWWRWIPAAEDTTNWDDGVTIGEQSIHSIGLPFGFSHSRFYIITWPEKKLTSKIGRMRMSMMKMEMVTLPSVVCCCLPVTDLRDLPHLTLAPKIPTSAHPTRQDPSSLSCVV